MSRTSTAAWKRVRRAVIYRAKRAGPLRCHWCGVALPDESLVDVDHLDPVGSGGAVVPSPDRCVVSCRRCNRSAGGRLGRAKQLAAAHTAGTNLTRSPEWL